MNHKFSIPLSIIIAVIIIGGSIYLSRPERSGAVLPMGLSFAEQAAQARNAAKPAAIVPTVDDDAGIGSLTAPVTIIEFSVYRCPFCAKFTKEIEPLIKEKYIDNGLVTPEEIMTRYAHPDSTTWAEGIHFYMDKLK